MQGLIYTLMLFQNCKQFPNDGISSKLYNGTSDLSQFHQKTPGLSLIDQRHHKCYLFSGRFPCLLGWLALGFVCRKLHDFGCGAKFYYALPDANPFSCLGRFWIYSDPANHGLKAPPMNSKESPAFSTEEVGWFARSLKNDASSVCYVRNRNDRCFICLVLPTLSLHSMAFWLHGCHNLSHSEKLFLVFF